MTRTKKAAISLHSINWLAFLVETVFTVRWEQNMYVLFSFSLCFKGNAMAQAVNLPASHH